MNYASAVFAAFFAIAAGWYFAWGKKHYAGPPTHEDELLAVRRSSLTHAVAK